MNDLDNSVSRRLSWQRKRKLHLWGFYRLDESDLPFLAKCRISNQADKRPDPLLSFSRSTSWGYHDKARWVTFAHEAAHRPESRLIELLISNPRNTPDIIALVITEYWAEKRRILHAGE